MKFEGARYIDQDGVLTDEGRVGRAESKIDHMNIGVNHPPEITRIIWSGEQEPTSTRKVEVGGEKVPTGVSLSYSCNGTAPGRLLRRPIHSLLWSVLHRFHWN